MSDRPYLIMKEGECLDWEGKISGPEVEYCKCTDERCRGQFFSCSSCPDSYESKKAWEDYWDYH